MTPQIIRCVLVLEGQYTRAERTSYNKRKYFTLGGCAGLEIFSVIVACSLCSCVLAFQDLFSLWEGVLVFRRVLEGQYTRVQRTSYNNRKYFTLGGCRSTGLKRPIFMKCW